MSTSPFFFKAFLGTNGRPAASGWFFAYAAGSTTPKELYSDINNTVPLTNPLRLDGNGVCPQFFTKAGLYDVKVYEYNFVTPGVPGPSCFTAEDIEGETGGGGGPSYVLPVATETILGGVKPDGVTTFVDVDGTLTAPSVAYTLPVATTATLGGVKPDGTTVQVDGVTGVLSVIPEDQTPELAGYAEGGYQEFTWINQTGDILENSNFRRGTNLFRIQDFLDGMVLKFRWIGRLDSMNTAQSCFIEGLIGGEVMGQFDLTPPSNGDYNVSYEATIYASSPGASTTYLGIQSRVDFSKNGSAPAAPLYSHTRYWSTNPFANNASVALGMVVTRAIAGGYRQLSFQAWMENAQRSSTPDPALIFQPLEDQRLSSDDSVTFATATARSVRLDTTTPDTTPVIGSTFWDDENQTTATHVAAGSVLQHGQELVVYARNNSGTPITDGQCVYITGASGNRPTIALADNDNRTASHIMAVATQNIGNNSNGYVTISGLVHDIDTSGFAEGAEVWLSDTPGGMTTTIPSGASVRARVGYVIRSHATQGAILVEISRFPFFSELSGNGVTTRTTTSATSSPTRFTRYTGSGGHTEPLPTATTISADRYYRNSGTGPWTIAAQGGEFIDPGNPSALVSSVTILPGQTLHIYVALTGLWEAF